MKHFRCTSLISNFIRCDGSRIERSPGAIEIGRRFRLKFIRKTDLAGDDREGEFTHDETLAVRFGDA